MGNPLVETLYAFKPPEGDFVNEDSIGDLVEICPAVKSIMSGGDNSTNNPTNRGFLSAMGMIFDLIAGSGLEECLSGITSPMVERIDKLMVSGKFGLIRDGKPVIPAVVDLMSGKPTPFAGGILLALACTVKRAEEDYGPAETVKSYGPPEAAAPEEPKPAPKEPKRLPSLDWSKDKPVKPVPKPDDVTKTLADLHRLGIPLENISLRPEKTDSGIKLQIAIQFGTEASFEDIAKINATTLAVLGKPVMLKSSAGIWVQMSL